MRIVKYIILIVMSFVMLASCGRKAAPTLSRYEQPPAPSSLTAVHRESTVILSWDYPRNKIKYVREFRIMRSDKVLGTSAVTHYMDTDAKSGKSYEYTIFAISSTGIVSDATAQVKVKTDEVPSAPTGLVVEVVDEGLRLLWSHPLEDVEFNVYRSPKESLNPILPANPEPISGNSYTDIPYMDKPIYYTVRAMLGGSARHEGPASEVVEVKPEVFVPSPPADLRATVAGDKVLIAWRESTEAWVNSYTVYRSLDGEDFSLIGETKTPSFIDNEGLKGNLYYKVKAMGPAVEGGFSISVMVVLE